MASPQHRSFSLTGPGATQLSQSIRERLATGSHSLPKPGTDLHLFQHRYWKSAFFEPEINNIHILCNHHQSVQITHSFDVYKRRYYAIQYCNEISKELMYMNFDIKPKSNALFFNA